jgi:hypothetical protein
MIAPGEKLVEHLNIPEENEYHFLFRGSLPRIVPENMAVTHFDPGTHAFSAFIGSSVFLYVAGEGTFEHQRIEKVIFQDLERSTDFCLDTALAWDGELKAKTQVSFIP